MPENIGIVWYVVPSCYRFLLDLKIWADGWGKCLRRLGAGSSTIYEYAKFVKIEAFLDPPEAITARLGKSYPQPFHNGKDREHISRRQRADRSIRVDHWLSRIF
jgi:hypothetical protein